jgi:hypothetical protein
MTTRRRLPALLGSLALLLAAHHAGAQGTCVGDCNGDGMVSINEVLTGVNIALGMAPLSSCPSFDTDHNGMLDIQELLAAVLSAVDGCHTPEPTQTAAAEPTPTATPAEFVAQPSDFECLTDWTHIRHFRITNKLGHLDEALAVAHGDMPPPYPVGTIIQLVPAEAMVKRGAGFFPAGDDWEFFVLAASPSGTQILKRGRDEVFNIGPPCFACHSAASHTDLICETTNGCVALGLTEQLINAIQDGDPRCPSRTPAIP